MALGRLHVCRVGFGDDGDRFGVGRKIGPLYLTYEPITLPGKGFDIARVIGRVP